MRVLFSERFRRSYRDAPPAIQKAFDRKAELLSGNLLHPSLHAKKYDEPRDVWQARVTRGWRFYFQIKDDSYYLVDITAHPK
jgi:mRNA interferase RelE/StbE